MAGYTSGNQIQFYCIEEKTSSDVGPNTNYPIGFTQSEWFEIYFRVKDWTIAVDRSLSASCTAGDASASASLSGTESGDSETVLTDESSFSCVNNLVNATIPNDSDYHDDFSSDFAVADVYTAFSVPSIGINYGPCYKVGSLYYPEIYMSFILRTNAYGGWSEGFPGYQEELFSSHYTPIDPFYSAYDIPLTVNGVSGVWTCTKYSANTGEGEGTATASADISSITLTPKSYWPYNPGDGAYYDSSTGATLRDPWSYQP